MFDSSMMFGLPGLPSLRRIFWEKKKRTFLLGAWSWWHD